MYIFNRLTWDVLDLEGRSAYICEYPQKHIGCLETGDNGANYNGTASKTWLGQECLRWDTEGLPQLDSSQGSWSHNYCRNPGGEDTDPICFANFEEPAICIIPRCQQRKVRSIEFFNLNDAIMLQFKFLNSSRWF